MSHSTNSSSAQQLIAAFDAERSQQAQNRNRATKSAHQSAQTAAKLSGWARLAVAAAGIGLLVALVVAL